MTILIIHLSQIENMLSPNFLLFLFFIGKICLGIFIGCNLYYYIKFKGYNLFRNNSLLELIIKFNIIYLVINKILFLFCLNIFLGSIFIDIFDFFNFDLANNMVDKNIGESNTPNTTNDSNSNNSNNSTTPANSTRVQGAEGAIMATFVAGGYALAQKMPSIAGKLGAVAGIVGIGDIAIVAKNVAANQSSDFGKKSFISWENLDSYFKLSDLFGLTGNNGLDLLIIINYFQKFSIFFTFLLIYQLLFKYISPDFFTNKLDSILPHYLLNSIKESLKKIQQLSNIFIIIFIILLLISNLLADYYLGFYIDNLEQIIEIYFKK